MIQRIGIAQALLADPEILILDEPMAGLDPLGRKTMRDIILRAREEGKTVLFSTHIIPDVEIVCDRVAILNRGQILSVGTVEDLVGREQKGIELVVSGVGMEALRRDEWEVMQVPQGVLVKVPGDDQAWQVIDLVREHGGKILTIAPIRASLEEVFMRTLDQG